WRGGHTDARVLECRHLRLRRAFAAADDRARVTHPASGRRRRTGDETGDRLLTIVLDPLSGFFFRAAADLPNHDDAVRVRVVIEELDHVQVRRDVERIAADADAR